jgi:lipopolysaccharide/colanic/teichoic acid biosynthesis glycosyltransferase
MQAGTESGQRPRRRRYPKRLLDLAIAIPAMLFLAPLFAAVALAVRLKLGRPIFFTQLRPGLEGRPFKLIKFRTMRDDVDPNGRLLSDAERLTRFGRFLRSTSLDELPELWNVVKGEMSLVGPRPLLLHYLDLYTPFQMRRHEERPGLTGWAQVNGRNALSWPEKFAHDVWYVENVSFLLDLRILLLTLVRIVGRHGITAEGEATMPYFQGDSGGEGEELSPQASGGRSGTET